MPNYRLTIRTISPVHIGSGDELRNGFDFVTDESKTYRLNVDAVLDDKGDAMRPDRRGNYPLPGNLLTAQDMRNPAYFRYVLPGAPRSTRQDARMQACIKDVYDRPYLPGSSIKGAMRTALAWTGWEEAGARADRRSIGRKRQSAGQDLERKIFGQDPNHDLLRALHVGDCSSKKEASEMLFIANAQVLTKRSSGSPIELEAILAKQVFRGELTIDDLLFQPSFQQELGFQNRKHWLDELMARVQRHSLARLRQMADWFDAADNSERVSRFLNQLLDFEPSGQQALMQLGWGTGWDGKTFWTHLQEDEYLFEKIVSDFKMNRGSRREAGDAFPRSRRSVMSVKDGAASPLAPFGWVLVEIKERSE